MKHIGEDVDLIKAPEEVSRELPYQCRVSVQDEIAVITQITDAVELA
jgi:hypothetical protein